MTAPCLGCPILPSCEKQHENPGCENRPFILVRHNLSNGFVDIARHRIAIVESKMPRKDVVGELRLRIEMCGGCP